MMLWKAVFSLQSNVGKDTFDFITSEVFSLLPKSFLAILMLMFVIYFGTRVRVRGPTWNPTMDVASLFGLATTGHIRSLKIFSVNVISIFPFVKIY